MYEFYNNKLSEGQIKKAIKKLKNLYSFLPETEGCLENINKPNGCSSWCCSEQNPQVSFAEFLYSWYYLSKKSKEDIFSVFSKAVQNYLSHNNKPCIFWNTETKLCNQHLNRPFNCRIYSQIPEEEFKPRYERLKILYPNENTRYQCDLTRVIGEALSKKDIDDYFESIKLIEKEVGVKSSLFHDGDGGSYRTYHDHLLLYLSTDSFLSLLTKIKTKGTDQDKERIIKDLPEKIKEFPRLKW